MSSFYHGVDEQFWDAVRAGRLILQQCETTKQRVFYPRVVCPECGVCELPWVEHHGTGILETFTRVRHAPADIEWPTPYVIGIANFDGARMFGLVVGDEEPVCDAPVEFGLPQYGEQRDAPYVFRITAQ